MTPPVINLVSPQKGAGTGGGAAKRQLFPLARGDGDRQGPEMASNQPRADPPGAGGRAARRTSPRPAAASKGNDAEAGSGVGKRHRSPASLETGPRKVLKTGKLDQKLGTEQGEAGGGSRAAGPRRTAATKTTESTTDSDGTADDNKAVAAARQDVRDDMDLRIGEVEKTLKALKHDRKALDKTSSQKKKPKPPASSKLPPDFAPGIVAAAHVDKLKHVTTSSLIWLDLEGCEVVDHGGRNEAVVDAAVKDVLGMMRCPVCQARGLTASLQTHTWRNKHNKNRVTSRVFCSNGTSTCSWYCSADVMVKGLRKYLPS